MAARRVEQHGRLGHLEAHALELVDGLAERLALRACSPVATSSAGRAAPMVIAAVPSRSGIIIVSKTAAPPCSRPSRFSLGTRTSRKTIAAGAAAAAAHEPVEVLRLHARAAVDDEAADPLVRLGRRDRCGRRRGSSRPRSAPDDEALLAVEDEVVAAVLGRGGGAEEVRAAARLGEALGGEDLAAQQRLHVLLALRVGAVQDDRRRTPARRPRRRRRRRCSRASRPPPSPWRWRPSPCPRPPQRLRVAARPSGRAGPPRARNSFGKRILSWSMSRIIWRGTQRTRSRTSSRRASCSLGQQELEHGGLRSCRAASCAPRSSFIVAGAGRRARRQGG